MIDFQNILLALNIVVSLMIAFVSLRKLKIPGAIWLTILSLAVTFWSLPYLLYGLGMVHFSKLMLISLTYFFSSIAATTLLVFSLIYSNHSNWVTRLTLVLLTIQPLVTQVLFWIEPMRRIFFTELVFSTVYLSPSTGLWADIHTIYLYNFEIASVILLTDIFTRKPRTLLLYSGTILAGSFLPLVFRFVGVFSQPPVGLFSYSIIGYSIAIIGLAYGLFRLSVVEVTPLTCETVVQWMTDGWMVLDLQNNIIDINPAAEKIIGISRNKVYGKHIKSILPDWPEISNATEGRKELEIRRSFRSQENWRYLNVRLSNLKNKDGNIFGQLVVWRDITERKMSENARQRARDEMFILLNAISNAASHSINLEDFLSESIYQIIYPFQSQAVAVFLVDDVEKDENQQMLRLAAYYGISSLSVRDVSNVAIPASLFEQVITTRLPMVINNVKDNPSVPDILKEMDLSTVILLPLYTQAGEDSKTLGALCLARRDLDPYTSDEVVRLTAIAEQIANLIDSDRRRQLAIALSERERLLRDLHDSVSQKLYGLVTLTEAAQAGLDAGSKVVSSQVLARIGESARQAVKEMRLFLYNMQPVDLEKEGLVTVLHHRLAAVEGRADIQARLLADENISISKEKEVALYFIAQEALNNVLKHAHASSVSVTLKQTRQNVVLEILDNGRGFEPANVERGGMGLQNMKVRTAKVNGKLKITSHPGDGTKIKVSVAREQLPKASKSRQKQ